MFDNLPKIVYLIENKTQNAATRIEHKYTGKKYVVISSTIEYFKDYYMFYLPIVSQAWRRLNFEPIILIASESLNNTNGLANIALNYLNLYNVTVVHVSTLLNYEVITGMISRLFCGLLPDNLVGEDDFIITSDSDLFPISKKYYQFDSSRTIKIWDSGSCNDFEFNGTKYKMYAMAHIGMRKKQWREVMQLDKKEKLNGETILKMIKKVYGDSFIKTNKEIQRGEQTKYPVWFLDQMTISMNIKRFVNVRKDTSLTDIKFRGTRLNRNLFFNANWFSSTQIKYLTDFHSFHENIFTKWNVFRQFLKQIFDLHDLKVFDEYYFTYLLKRNSFDKDFM